MGLDVYLVRGPHVDGCSGDHVSIDSTRHPEHFFKIGYWRSSYNDGGINAVLRQYGLPDLYEMCGVDKNDDAPAMDWPRVLADATAAIMAFDAAADLMEDRVWRKFLTPAWYRQALEIVKETAEWVLSQPDPGAFHTHWSLE